ncbi:MAG: sigma-70 family RNA polymerase sigma factor [Pseudomonadota bacterium]
MARFTERLPRWGQARQARRDELVEVLRAHAGLVLASAIRVVGTMHEAEDVAQDIAERLLRSPPADVRNWPAYLKTLAVNGAIDRLRKRRPTADADELPDITTPETELEAGERAEALRDAIATLSEREASLFSLYYFADLSQADIGKQLDMTENAVGVALHRVRQRLSRDLRARLQLEHEDN